MSGTIKNEKVLPLASATISALGNNNSVVTTAVTDAKGNYSIRVSDQVKSIRVAYVGLEEKTIALGGKTVVSTQLLSAASNLNEVVVVVGYGVQRKKDLTGSVATIGGDKVRDMPLQSFDQGHSGRAADVKVSGPM